MLFCFAVFSLAMDDMLANLWGKFSLREEESLGISVDEEELDPLLAKGKVCAVGKILADRIIPKDSYKGPLSHMWRQEGNISFKSLGENLFIVEFETEWDKDMVLEGRPWLFDGLLVSVVDFDGTTPPSKMIFDKAAFWIRMFNLPLACMGKEIGHKIGSSVGYVEEVDVTEGEAGWGEFLRVRVMVDVTKPLAKGRMLHVKGQSLWIDFKYERLPRFCFHCGVIRHGNGGCGSIQNRATPGGEGDLQYGTWLRVSYPTRKGGNVDQNKKNRKGSDNKSDQSDGNSSDHGKDMRIEKSDGRVEEGGCSRSLDVPVAGGVDSDPKESILVEQVSGDDHATLEGLRAIGGERISSKGVELEGSTEMTDAALTCQLLEDAGGLLEKRDACPKMDKGIDASVDMRFETHEKGRLTSRRLDCEKNVKPVSLSSFGNISDDSNFALKDNPKQVEKMGIAHSKFLGQWNSEKGYMEWTELVDNVSGLLGDSCFSKISGSTVLKDGESQRRARDDQGSHSTVQHEEVNRGKFSSQKTVGKKKWKKRARDQLTLEDERELDEGDPFSSNFLLGETQNASPTKRAKLDSAVAAGQPRHSQ